jgi:hypothetical protein
MAETSRIELLALIHLTVAALSKDMSDEEFADLKGLVENLIRHTDERAQTYLTPTRTAILKSRTPTAFEAWQVRNAY